MKNRLEVHRHTFISGPRSGQTIEHSHEGPKGHQHSDMGPATYTICRKEWFAATGLSGGGVKKFSVKPKGEQFPLVDLEDWQKSFRIIVGEHPRNHGGEGGGFVTAVRMVKQFGMTVKDDTQATDTVEA